MRIIAGTHRGRPILGPEDAKTTRPITDRVKQSLFDRLAAADRIDGARVLDLFSGTGSMGLECLSRGAEHVTFVERDRSALARLKQNLAALKHVEQTTVVNFDALGQSVVDIGRRQPYSLVFCDPPYEMTERDPERTRVAKQIARLVEACTPGALLVLRTSKHVEATPIEGWSGPTSHGYGSMVLHFYEMKAPVPEGPAI